MQKNIVYIVVPFLLFSIFSGCRNKKERGSDGGSPKPEEISAYGMTLTAESYPGKVAGLFIKALDNGDTDILKKLVAVEDARKETEAIFGKYGKATDMTSEKVSGLVIAGWKASYAFFREGQTSIFGIKVEGGNAEVYATAVNKSTGKNGKILICLVKENGWWKVKAGIETL